MRTSLAELLATGRVLLADGATGTNYFEMGLESGQPPEFWNVDHPERVLELHQRFVDAGADIILTNTFGCNAHRLKLHRAEERTFELAQRAAALAREIADAADHPVVVAGSIGPTGELFAPLGALGHDGTVAVFRDEIAGLQAGGADVAWIETMSAVEEVRAAAQAAIDVGMAYVATCSFDTAGRTMMGLMPDQLATVFDGLTQAPLAMGANCGVGASDILVTLLAMTEHDNDHLFISKGNCGIPQFRGTEIHYSGTPELMGRYVELAIRGGARIVGGCCGTSATHLAAMRAAIDGLPVGGRPSLSEVVSSIGPLANAAPTANIEPRPRRRGGRTVT